MSFFRDLFRMLFKNKGLSNQKKKRQSDRSVQEYSTKSYENELTRGTGYTLRAKTEMEKELEERVWKAQLQHRSKVLKERFAAQQEWMAKYEQEEAERRARKESMQRM